MLKEFLAGKFDPQYKQTKYAMKRMRAAISKPETTKVTVECDWSEDAERKALEKVRMAEKQKQAAKIALEQSQKPVPGVRFNRLQRRWVAEVTHKSVRYHLGTFENRAEAINARLDAQEKLLSGKSI